MTDAAPTTPTDTEAAPAATTPAPAPLKRHACACCEYRTRSLEPVPGAAPERCPVCGWVSDFRQERDPQLEGRPNRVSLSQARASFRAIGAADVTLRDAVRAPLPGERRVRWAG